MIIISGDSGTGKTFNANKALNFLAALNDVPSAPSMQSSKVRDIVRKISSACPLISAFSTATTEKNAKSSRHGQLVKLQYSNGFVSGATIRSFLLERSRVTMGYDNFHIFYQVSKIDFFDVLIILFHLYQFGFCFCSFSQDFQRRSWTILISANMEIMIWLILVSKVQKMITVQILKTQLKLWAI